MFQPLRATRPSAEKAAVVALFVILLGLTWVVWSVFRERDDQHARLHFEYDIEEIVTNIEGRMAVYEQVLLGGVGLFNASDSVTRRDWNRYVDSLRLSERFPGIQGVGFSLRIEPENKAAHIAGIRSEGFPNYDILPLGERAIYTSIIYLEPFGGRNLRAFGFDMFSEPTRRAAMEAARDSGRPRLSGRVTLVQETERDVQAGVLLHVPVYRRDISLADVDARRDALVGYVYSPFRMNDLMKGLLGKETDNLRLRIFDGTLASQATLLFDSAGTEDYLHDHAAVFESLRRIQVNGRPWLVQISSLPGFESDKKGQVSLLIALIGALLSIMLASAAWFFTVSKAVALADTRRIVEDRTADLRSSEDRLRSIIETAVTGMVTIDERGTILSFNPAAERIFGYAAHEMLGQNVKIIVPSPHKGAHDDYIRRYLETGKASIIGIGRDVEGERKDGSRFPMRLGIGEARTAAGRLFTGVITDLSKEKAAEAALHDRQEQLVAARDQAEAANRSKSEFLAMMSHEIRTPIHGVMGAIGLVASAKDEKERKRWTDLATRSATSLLAIINDVLDFSKIEAGRIDIYEEPGQIRGLVQATAESLAPLARDKGLTYEIEFGGQVDAWVSFDAGRLRQILSNLIGNAIKFTRRGFIRVRAETFGETADGLSLRLTVTDSGIGIPASERDKLFQEFARLDRQRRGEVEGSGLGLAISQRLARHMGGDITVESAEGAGSAFQVELPLRFTVAPASTAADSEAPLVSSEPLDILVVDDSQANCDIAKAYLAAAGHRVSLASNGLDGFSAVLERRFDVVIMDMVMPVMDGVEASRRIRALGGNKGAVPIIGLTADVTSNRARFIEVGVATVLTKPIAGPALVAAVNMAGGQERAAPPTAQPTTAAAKTDDGIDWKAVNRIRAELGVQVANSLLTGFVDEMTARADVLKMNVGSGDLPTLMKEAHRLAGSAGSYGLAEASSLACKLEASCAAGDQEKAAADVESLVTALVRGTTRLHEDIQRGNT